MPFYGDILRANFFDLKNSKNRQNSGDLEPLKDFGPNFFSVKSPSDIFKPILEND
jgi:hypothetical protein